MNAMCVASSGDMVLSGDSLGVVMVWSKEEAGEMCVCVCVSYILPALLVPQKPYKSMVPTCVYNIVSWEAIR